jgi:RimJ/RimL family protein N-acetyltransferase
MRLRAGGVGVRRADLDDVHGYHTLAANPLVYRYLFDGVPPDKEYITRLLTQSVTNTGQTALGMWFLENVSARYAGCVELRPYPSFRSAELTYLLDPSYWGQGLALKMAWTVIAHAFLMSQIDFIIAGADLPNTPLEKLCPPELGTLFSQTISPAASLGPLSSRCKKPRALPSRLRVAFLLTEVEDEEGRTHLLILSAARRRSNAT